MKPASELQRTPDANVRDLSDTLLDLFSPVPDRPVVARALPSRDERALWAADALHRANNLAQMSSSLASHRLRRQLRLSADDHIGKARALARAYAELGADEGTGRPVPCAPLLETIVDRLVALFGHDGAVRLEILADPVVLPSEQRRALTLVASELVINALKYAFPPGMPGRIQVMCRRQDRTIELSVADNGCGIAPDAVPVGGGTMLLSRLCALLNADIERINSRAGFRVVVRVPIADDEPGQ